MLYLSKAVLSTLFAAWLCGQTQTFAQLPTSPDQPATGNPPLRKSVLKVDILYPLVNNARNNLFVAQFQPVIWATTISYEHLLNRNWSIQLDGISNGGGPRRRISGYQAQVRYVIPGSIDSAAANSSHFYVAPQVSYRVYKERYPLDPLLYYSYMGGAGLLAGRLCPTSDTSPAAALYPT